MYHNCDICSPTSIAPCQSEAGRFQPPGFKIEFDAWAKRVSCLDSERRVAGVLSRPPSVESPGSRCR